METRFNRWIVITCLLALIIPGITAGINYFMDPLWCFSPSHRFNQKQDDFNERQQKTNYITFHDFNYQGIIIGSSTGTNIDQRLFRGIKVYNYSINGMQMSEMPYYLDYARRRNGRDFDYIFLGLDFINSSRLAPPPFKPEQVIADTNHWLYRIETLISIGTLKFSRRNFMNYLYGRHLYYDRNNIKHVTPITREQLDFNIKKLMEIIERSDTGFSFKKYRYNEEYRSMLHKLREGHPKTRFVVFTTPVIDEFMTSMADYNLLDDYLRWLTDIVHVFGTCYHFMYPCALSREYYENFHDPNHYYPHVSALMVDAMYNSPITGDSPFGMLLTRENLKTKLAHLKRLIIQTAARRKAAGGR
ncbi:MAG: hypothetical protein JW807_13825 [Spirochaetes bacterium]|nr:hypothetical protein [Spirochaetota bacterium]